MPITPDYRRHDPYLEVIAATTDLREATTAMSLAAGRAGRALETEGYSPGTDARLQSYIERERELREQARAYLDRLRAADPPVYMRSAHVDLQAAIELHISAAARGAEAVERRDRRGLDVAAEEMEAASRDIVSVAGRITDWRSGAAQ